MKEILSKDNLLIKNLKKQKDDLLFLDTPKLIIEAIYNNIEIDYFLVEKGKVFDFIKSDENVITTSASIIEQLCSVKNSQGIVAITKPIKTPMQYPTSNFLVLDNIQDAGNVGTLIRSALGANFNYIYLINCASISNIKTIRSSMGAIFKTVCIECDLDTFCENYKNWNYKLYGCDMNGENIFKTDFKNKLIGIAIGNEGNGLSNKIRELCSNNISIPMSNNLESLNAAVSGSIIMYQISKGE